MLKNLNNVFIFLASLVITCHIQAKKGPDLPERTLSHSKTVDLYWKTYDEFREKVCKKNTLSTFEEKLKAYRGEGIYLPIISGKVYPEVFPEIISELNKKNLWLEKNIQRLKVLKYLPNVQPEIKNIKLSIDRALSFQEKTQRFSKVLTDKEKKAHREALISIKKNFASFLSKSFYLGRYIDHVDHLKNRLAHDALAGKKDLSKKIEQKRIFLLRKILEDGAPGDSHSGSDKYFRTTLDTLNITIPLLDNYLDENHRYDLEYVMDIASRVTRLSTSHYLKRFMQWHEQSTEQLAFYKKLKAESEKSSKELSEMLARNSSATNDLSHYVVDRQLETYLFWKDQPEIMQALYALETILFNEVGGVDPSGLERRDVLQVVLNRFKKTYYRRLKKSQRLYTLVNGKGISRTQYPWLNILFNRGEFSFTLYYFKASHETFCPTMSKSMMPLRQENLEIGLKILENPDWSFDAERYFSRASMTGRIDMSSVWNEFKAVEERAGDELSKSRAEKLSKALKAKKYRYLYQFTSKEVTYYVVDINSETRVFTEGAKGNISWYSYRNPHYFRYFSLK